MNFIEGYPLTADTKKSVTIENASAYKAKGTGENRKDKKSPSG